jgi:hypothetical protein
MFNLSAAVSLVLFLTITVLWVRSYWSSDTVGWQTLHISKSSMDSHFHGLYWSVGYSVIVFNREQYVSDLRDLVYVPRDQEGTHLVAYGFRPGEVPNDYPSGWHGFFMEFHQNSIGSQTGVPAVVGVPVWLLATVMGILPLVRAIHFAQTRSALKVCCCLSCGYNLTGNISGVCPECGTKIQQRISN